MSILQRFWAREIACVAVLTACTAAPVEEVGSSNAALSTVCGAPPSGAVQGVDVSVYQGAFDWNAQKAGGISFGYARIGDGLGGDSEFTSNWSNMKAAGVLRGAYQFFEPGEDEVAQANLMIGAVGKLGQGDLPCMIDVEVTGGQSGGTIAAKVAHWISLVQQGTGKAPIIYTGPYFWEDNVGSASFGATPLWVADYGPSCPLIPSGWATWTFWQYSDGGGSLDHDVFNGTLADLQKLAGSVVTNRDVVLTTSSSGYVLDSAGQLHEFGGAPHFDTGLDWSPNDLARSVALQPAGPGGYVLDAYGGIHPFGGAPAITDGPYWPNWDIARSIVVRKDGKSGYVLDGWGGMHAFGGAPDESIAGYWKGQDNVAKDLVLRSDGRSGYVLDMAGAIWAFGGAPPIVAPSYWAGQDFARSIVLSFDDQSGYVADANGGVHPFGNAVPIGTSPSFGGSARALALASDGVTGLVLDENAGTASFSNAAAARSLPRLANGTSGYALDGWGAVHAFGGAPALDAKTSWPNWDIARRLVLRADGASGWVLDGWGGLHPFGDAPAATAGYWPNWDIARGVVALTDGTSGLQLDGFGGLHPFGSAVAVTGAAYWPNWDIARDVALRDATSGYTLDGWGGIHPFGNAPAITDGPYWKGWDIARAIVLRSDGVSGYVLDGYGGVHPFGNAPAATGYGYWPGWDVARDIVLTKTGGFTLDVYGGVHAFTVPGGGSTCNGPTCAQPPDGGTNPDDGASSSGCNAAPGSPEPRASSFGALLLALLFVQRTRGGMVKGARPRRTLSTRSERR